MQADFGRELFLRGQHDPLFLSLVAAEFVVAFEEAPMSCIQILLSFLQVAFNDVHFCESEQAWEQEDTVIASQFILGFADELVQFVMGLLN